VLALWPRGTIVHSILIDVRAIACSTNEGQHYSVEDPALLQGLPPGEFQGHISVIEFEPAENVI
jgi:hypothetical protein